MVQLHVARTALSCRQLVRSEHIINRRRRDLRAPACAGFGNWQKKRERKEAERKSREWEEVQASGRVDAESGRPFPLPCYCYGACFRIGALPVIP
jgi:hypothetical protein